VTRAVLAALALALGPAVAAAGQPTATWHPGAPRVGEAVWVHVRGLPVGRAPEGELAGRPLGFFPVHDGYAALAGLDLETPAGSLSWTVRVPGADRGSEVLSGRLLVRVRDFPLQRLTLPQAMVDLDPATERRAVAEAERLRTLYRAVSPERLWRGRFVVPVTVDGPGTGFGARRVINGQPRAPHSGLDFGAPHGAPVMASNSGRVALVADYFFPGRLVIVDHGLGVYTLYFHLDEIRVRQEQHVERGQTLGTVGSTGRATGPHLHFAVLVRTARVDPTALLDLALPD